MGFEPICNQITLSTAYQAEGIQLHRIIFIFFNIQKSQFKLSLGKVQGFNWEDRRGSSI